MDVQYASDEHDLPPSALFEEWAQKASAAVAKNNDSSCELAIRIVDQEESAHLNQKFRNKSGATNVLSFPMEVSPGVPLTMLGDLVICAPVVRREALEHNKEELAHWAHMVVHGVLHLHGFDHLDDALEQFY